MTALATALAAPAECASRGARLRRVLYATRLDPSRKYGSMEEQAFLLASAFRERGGLFLPVFAAPPEPVGLGRYKGAGLDFAALDLGRFRPRTLLRLLALVVRRRIEVVDWNFFAPLTNGYVWALSALAPWVEHQFTDHNSRQGAARRGFDPVKKLLLRRYRRVIGVSGFVADCLRGHGVWPAPDSRLHFVNTDRFVPDPAARTEVRARLGADGRFVMLAVAYLIRAKGIDVAVRALARLPKSATLWVIGDGDQSAALEALAAELGVGDRVRFLGLQGRVEPYMQAADALVCPSTWAEAAGLVNIEAQACGLPVLASRIGGIPEYVADGRTGLLFPPGDDAALADAARRLMDDPALLGEMGRAARETAVARFSAAARMEDYLRFYRSPMEGSSR